MTFYTPNENIHKIADRIFYEYKKNNAREVFFCSHTLWYVRPFWFVEDNKFKLNYKSYCHTLKEWERCFAIYEWDDKFSYSKKIDLWYLQAVKLYNKGDWYSACFNNRWKNIILYSDWDSCDFLRFLSLLLLVQDWQLWHLKLEIKPTPKSSIQDLKKITAEISRIKKHDTTKVFFPFDVLSFDYSLVLSNDWTIVKRDYKKWYLYNWITKTPFPNSDIIKDFYGNYIKDFYDLIDEIRGRELSRNSKEEMKIRDKVLKQDCFSSVLFDGWEADLYLEWILKMLKLYWIPYNTDHMSESGFYID